MLQASRPSEGAQSRKHRRIGGGASVRLFAGTSGLVPEREFVDLRRLWAFACTSDLGFARASSCRQRRAHACSHPLLPYLGWPCDCQRHAGQCRAERNRHSAGQAPQSGSECLAGARHRPGRAGLGGRVEVVGGVWVLLLSFVGLRVSARSPLAWQGLMVGVSRGLTVVPGLRDLGRLLGLTQILWSADIGIALLPSGAAAPAKQSAWASARGRGWGLAG